jgi:hypothetical protein
LYAKNSFVHILVDRTADVLFHGGGGLLGENIASGWHAPTRLIILPWWPLLVSTTTAFAADTKTHQHSQKLQEQDTEDQQSSLL